MLSSSPPAAPAALGSNGRCKVLCKASRNASRGTAIEELVTSTVRGLGAAGGTTAGAIGGGFGSPATGAGLGGAVAGAGATPGTGGGAGGSPRVSDSAAGGT